MHELRRASSSAESPTRVIPAREGTLHNGTGRAICTAARSCHARAPLAGAPRAVSLSASCRGGKGLPAVVICPLTGRAALTEAAVQAGNCHPACSIPAAHGETQDAAPGTTFPAAIPAARRPGKASPAWRTKPSATADRWGCSRGEATVQKAAPGRTPADEAQAPPRGPALATRPWEAGMCPGRTPQGFRFANDFIHCWHSFFSFNTVISQMWTSFI